MARDQPRSEKSAFAEESPYQAVNQAKERLQQEECVRFVDVSHDTRCTLNAAGTGETTETTHRLTAHVAPEDVEEFRAALGSIGTQGFSTSHEEGSERDGTDKFELATSGR